ncbi:MULTISPECIES: glycoside hydrolase family 43 protein [unclassified Sphingomonas]|uniref:glycoside hydrolase family 43 protein n=1 Tax=unclassified Sphingomonas TaxID=196159 RepID=UPI00285B4D7B|nr:MULTISPECIES: glycoside hydrolase family 43 protein [unclassified Sphingomonas]MDR6115629.1 xylan 1,4-beta-xylosidase [Sphingomonas sp. SORGH_AS_0789]MDR6150700.1 xylan 1,4-beta-xylosidase [Sphingomonas sp. SORGH_AS_0742]
MIRRSLTALGLGLAIAGGAAAQTASFDRFTYQGRSLEQVKPKAGEYLNPIVAGYYPDPSVTRVGKDYYLVNSSFAHFPGLPIFHSTDLVHWTQIGNAIDRPGQLDFSGRAISEAVFAPDISYHDGTFYIVNTCVQCRGNFVITATNPAGPWSDPIWLPFEGIDPSLYWEGDRAYIVNNRAPAEPPRYDGHRAIWIQEYDWRAGKMVGESTQLINGGVDLSKKPVWIEGPHIFKKDGWYYLTAAEGGTSVNHSQVVLRSKQLRRPYVPFAGNPILTQRDLDPARPHPISAAGHAELVQTQNGDWWATFLATRPYAEDYYNIGRETFLLPVTWRDGWPIILDKGKTVPWTQKRPQLPASPTPTLPTSGDFGYTDEFDGQRLAMQWIGIRTPRTPFYSVANGRLSLNGGAALGDRNGVPAFVGRRQQHVVADVSTTLTFTPSANGARAGLAAMQNDYTYLFFGLTRIDGQPRIALYAREGRNTRDETAPETLIASAPFAAKGPVTLTIHARGGTMSFDYQADGRTATLKSDMDVRFLSTAKAGGFVGTVIGPYAYSPQ